MPRPSHKPEPTTRRQVEAMAGYGVPEAEIAGMLGIDAKTLRKHYRQELDQGHTKANMKVAENLFRKATGDGREAVIAAIFWMKTRARWRETVLNEHSGIDGQPITAIKRIILSAPDMRSKAERDLAVAQAEEPCRIVALQAVNADVPSTNTGANDSNDVVIWKSDR